MRTQRTNCVDWKDNKNRRILFIKEGITKINDKKCNQIGKDYHNDTNEKRRINIDNKK